MELPAAADYRAFLSVTSFTGNVRTVTFTCLELRPDLQNPTVGELETMGALPVELPDGFVEALDATARVRMLKGRVGLAMSLESDRARPTRVSEALEAVGFRRVGEPPSWSFEREQDGMRQSAMIAGNGATLTLLMGGLHWTFSYGG